MLLNGLVRCASCRYTMGTHRAPNGGIYMLCTRARQYGDCPDPVAVRVNDLKRDHVVDTDHEALGLEEIVTRMLLEEKVPALDLEARAYGAAAGVTELGNEVKSAKLVLDGYMAEREDIIESASRDAFLTGLQARQRALDDARTAYETALAEHGAGVTESFRSLRDDWATMTVAERRDQLSSVVRCVFVRNAPQQQYGVSRDRVHVVWIDDPEVDLPRQGRRNYVIHPFAFDGRDDPRHVGVAP
jgi:Recombinase zinc beta ribbon domain